MCGICGVYGLEDRSLVQKMCKALEHRGPDDEGFFLDSKVSLGHRRLSIIDLSAGHQPVHNESETIWIVFNGEIYNFKELRSDLEGRHQFYTASDTEVLVHLYEEYGEMMMEKLNGMFAFALWDSEKKKLILARDPLGKKPLYYCWRDDMLFFASEIKAILEAGVRKEIDLQSMCSYLAYQYTLGEQTIFKGIKKIPAGHMLVIENDKSRMLQYWDIRENLLRSSELELVAVLRVLLERSARYRMIADVDIGAFLSGGIDSSATVALTRPLADYEFHTFSVGFETFSELEYARKVSEHLDTSHHEIIITSDMVSRDLKKIAWHYDEPLGDAAIINNYFLSKEARKFVKVVIAGEAGDELFGGYVHHQMGLKYHNYFKIPMLNEVVRSIDGIIPRKEALNKSKLERSIEYLSQPTQERFQMHLTRIMSNGEIRRLSNLEPNDIEKFAVFPKGMKGTLNKILYLDCKNLLPEKFLMKADKATMANGVEERLPLMDKNIVEFAFSIPSYLKINNGVEKYILREAVKDLLPREIVGRKKLGFGTPIADWMNNGLKDLVLQVFSDNSLIKTYFREDKINKMVQDFYSGDTYRSPVVWNIFALGLWYDVYFAT